MLWKTKMTGVTHGVRVLIPKDALDVIFDECDRFDRDETGGRIVGFFEDKGAGLTLRITGLIEAGPKATRSPTSFFQDGDYQEPVFREIESEHPAIEHLGTWHTHHVNGLQTLSGGDIATYRKTVNHPNQHTPFFYALLVVAKNRTRDRMDRYTIKHFLFRPNDDRVYEIPESNVSFVEDQLMWPRGNSNPSERPSPRDTETASPSVALTLEAGSRGQSSSRTDLVYDRDVLSEFFPDVKAFKSEQLGIYWKGAITLADASRLEVVITEDASAQTKSYSAFLREPAASLQATAERLSAKEFPSSRAALIHIERSCNQALFENSRLEGAVKRSRK